MGAVGGVLRATSGPPSVSTVSSVKNPALQANIDAAIGGFGDYVNQGNAAFANYLSQWNAGQPGAAARTGQEIGALDQFYNGGMANQLAQLRAQRARAMTNAADVASQQAIRALNASRVTGQGGLSSYNQRLAMANLTPIRVQAALDDANQARADLGYLTQNQIGLAGQRQGMANQLAGYGLVPTQQRLAMLQGQAGYLGMLGNLDQQNKFYGLQQKPNMWADVADSLDQGILNAAAIYGSVGAPGMGGGGKGMSRGGMVKGPGTGTSDSIKVRLSKGEFVVPADVVKIPGILPLLERMRHMHEMHYVGQHQEALKNEIKSKKESAKGMGMKGGGKVRGYADGGLAGSAQQLGARAMADLTPTWMPPVLLGDDSPGSDWARQTPMPRIGMGATPMPRASSPSMPYFNPTNMSDISPEWRAYGRRTAAYYNDPTSPGYIAPGTYE